MLVFETKCCDTSLKGLVILVSPPLTPVGVKFVYEHSQRDAGFATIAIGAVSEEATAPKALGYQLGVGIALNQVARGRNL